MPADYMTTESRLPFSLEAEQSVLGAALLDAGCVPDLVRLVRPEFFYREQHRKIFEVISGKFTLGEPIDIVTVMEAAVREEIFSTPEETKAYLAQLAQMVPSVRNLEAYTNILQSKYHLRALITTSRDIIEQAEAPTAQPEGLLEYAEQRIYDIRNGHNNDSLIPVSRVVLETFDHLQRLSVGVHRAGRPAFGAQQVGPDPGGGPPRHGQNGLRPQYRRQCGAAGQKDRRYLFAGNEP